MEADVSAVCGPRGKHDPDRTATRHGTERGSVTLGGRRVPVTRPRVRATDGTGEVPVPAYELFNATELLGKMAMERMLGGLSTRRYPVGAGAGRRGRRGGGEVDEQVGGLAQVRGDDRARAGRPARRRPVRAGPGRVDDRRGPLRRPPVCRRAGHRHRRDQAPAGAGRGIDGEHHPGPRACWSGCASGAWTSPGRSWPCWTAPRRWRPAVKEVFDQPVIARCQTAQAAGTSRDHLPEKMRGPVAKRMRAAYHADSALEAEALLRGTGQGTGQDPPRRRRQPARGAGRDADRAPPRRPAHPGQHAAHRPTRSSR